ncbi:MAG: CotH kinase family protein, partial [Bacteroidota bacterium]
DKMASNQIKLILSLFFLTLFNQNVSSQSLIPDLNVLFQDDIIPRIDIELPPDSLAEILDFQNLESNYHFHATFIFDNGSIRDTLENVGFRLRGNTSRYADKKSFKISFNTYEPGRKYYGVEKLNLNGEHNDPTILRSKLGWDIARQYSLVGSRANHVRFYINGEYRGLYLNVEHIDEEFVNLRYGSNDGNLYKCLYPADLDYLGQDPDVYKLEVFGRQPYDLKTNTDEDDYTKLAHFIDVLNNTPTADLPCELEKVFNVNQYLKYIAFDVLTGNWDGPIYNKNNFYLYENPLTEQIEYIPYDIDNTFGIDWFGIDWADLNIYEWSPSAEPRPLYTRLMETPEFRDRYTFYLRKMITDIFNPSHLNLHIDNLKANMDQWRVDDPFAPLDYGYSFDDYEKAFDESLSGHVKKGLKEYIEDRYLAAISQWEQPNILPILTDIQNNFPSSNQNILVSTFVEDDGDIASVELHYQLDNQGSLLIEPMYDDGNHDDGAANDGIYGAIVPAIGTGGIVNYFVKAIDNTGLENRAPKCTDRQIFVSNSDLPLYINEFMASNSSVVADVEGEYDDWVEIYNGGSTPIYLGDKFLSDNMNNPDKWQMPDLSIQSGEYLLFWADDDEDQGDFHTNFKLSASGEFIGIFDAASNNFALIDGEDFGQMDTNASMARLPDGVGFFELATPTPGESNMPLSTEVLEVFSGLKIYPNPATQVLHVVFENPNTGGWSVEIFTTLGVQVFEQNNIAKSNLEISLASQQWNAGVYFVKIKTASEEYLVRKILVE